MPTYFTRLHVENKYQIFQQKLLLLLFVHVALNTICVLKEGTVAGRSSNRPLYSLFARYGERDMVHSSEFEWSMLTVSGRSTLAADLLAF